MPALGTGPTGVPYADLLAMPEQRLPTSAARRTLDQLVERHYAVVYNLAYRTLGRRQDAEDIAQQTFARALTRLPELRDDGAAGSWLCRIAVNLCIDELRRRERTVDLPDIELDAL